MKKIYETPEMSIMALLSEDVIRTSDDNDTPFNSARMFNGGSGFGSDSANDAGKGFW